MSEYSFPQYLHLAYDLAHKYHEDQVDKQGEPYVGHVERVANRVQALWYFVDYRIRGQAKAAAYLHDIVEDTDMTLDGLKEYGIPGNIIDLVDLLTRREDQTYPNYIDRIVSSGNALAIHIKICDIVDNTDPTRLNGLDGKTRHRLESKYGYAFGTLVSGWYKSV